MNLIELKCKRCGAILKVNPNNPEITCSYCHTKFILNEEVTKMDLNNMEQSGYNFEKGRMRAQQEADRQKREEAEARAREEERKRAEAAALAKEKLHKKVNNSKKNKTQLIIITAVLLVIFVAGIIKIITSFQEPEIPSENPIVTMTIEDYGDIVMELYPQEVYNTVANFVTLVESGFYDNNAITRVQKGFVIQAGGEKELNYTIKGEFESNGIENNIKHERGVISMARGNNKDSASGQFFIMLGTATYLDGNYAAFGKVIEGMDVIEKIEKANLKCMESNYCFLEPDSYFKITKATVDTKGYKYKVDKIRF